MALFNWGKKEPKKENVTEDTPPAKPDPLLEWGEALTRYNAARHAKYVPPYSGLGGLGVSTTTGGSVPFGAAAMGVAAAASYAMYGAGSVHGLHIKLETLFNLYGIEPYAVIKLAEYFTKQGIKTEEDAKSLIEELNSV